MNIFIYTNLFLSISVVALILDNYRLGTIRNKNEEEIEELKDLKIELNRENQGYRKVVRKWEMEQDRKNKDDWGI